jgi:hypothetical protein
VLVLTANPRLATRALADSDLHPATGGVLVRRGKGGKRREIGMDRWAWDQIEPWLDHRVTLPVSALLCVVDGATAGRPWSPSAAMQPARAVVCVSIALE